MLVNKVMLIGDETAREVAEKVKDEAVEMAPMSVPSDSKTVNTILTAIKDTKKGSLAEIKKLVGSKKLSKAILTDHGALRRSALVEETNRTDKTVTYTVSFDPTREGKEYNYALVQHEETSFHHTIGEAKYLEKAVINNRNELKDRIAKKVKKKG